MYYTLQNVYTYFLFSVSVALFMFVYSYRDTTVPPNTGSDTNLASITTLMSGLSNRNAAQSAKNDKEEIIDYSDIPKECP